MRDPRSFFRKLVSRADYRCTSCRRTICIRRPYLSIFQRYCECPRCGTRTLSRIFSRDRVDKMTRNPIRWMLALVGAPLYHCIYCRYQFRDWRKRESDDRVNPTFRI